MLAVVDDNSIAGGAFDIALPCLLLRHFQPQIPQLSFAGFTRLLTTLSSSNGRLESNGFRLDCLLSLIRKMHFLITLAAFHKPQLIVQPTRFAFLLPDISAAMALFDAFSRTITLLLGPSTTCAERIPEVSGRVQGHSHRLARVVRRAGKLGQTRFWNLWDDLAGTQHLPPAGPARPVSYFKAALAKSK